MAFMRAVLPVIGIICGLIWLVSPAEAARCPVPNDGRVPVEVRTSQANADYRYDQSTKQITRLHGREGTTESRRHEGQILGLTRVQFEWSMSMERQATRLADGTICLRVTAVNATLSIPILVVYVSSDYRRGGCEFAAILAHENAHVQRTTALLRPYAAKMEDALRDAVRRLSPRAGRSVDTMDRELMAGLKRSMAAVVAALEKERARVNGQLDTEDNYRRTASRCGSW